jgi:(1->4)-alpha-D-glucan 1-alpha-D-glucosylmutase
VRALLRPPGAGRRAPFLPDLARFVAEVARPGLWNALARTLVHLSAPGIPDLYQGDELWSFALVDPDNRRPVDFAGRRRQLAALEAGSRNDQAPSAGFLRRLVSRPEDGRIKLQLIRSALSARRSQPRLFLEGSYHPLEARGARAKHVLAFARRAGKQLAVVVVPRLPRTLVGDGARAPLGPRVWGDTVLRLPPELAGRSLRSALTRSRVAVPRPDSGPPQVRLAVLLAELPVALHLARTR